MSRSGFFMSTSFTVTLRLHKVPVIRVMTDCVKNVTLVKCHVLATFLISVSSSHALLMRGKLVY